MTNTEDERIRIKKAVIYARVSSAKQTTRGDGLGSQETRCREFARYKGYEIAEIFTDDSSGSLTTRPGMQAMLAWLRKRTKRGPVVVIIDDISRLARGVEAHLQLRGAISKAGGILQSPTIEFGEDSDSILVENLLASVSQHQRQKNGEQTINRMRARTMNGYWVFQAPIGYRYQRVSGHGNMLVRDEPYASILEEALEGFASGRFDSQAEVKRFLESQPDFPKDVPNGEIRAQRITEFLTRPIYAGYVHAPSWDVSLRKGHHQGLIDYTTYQKIQTRLEEGVKAPARSDINADFPLRGFVTCADCDKPLTACWSKSKTGKKHPYYQCFNKACVSARKSIPRAKIEGEFDQIMRALQPTEDLIELARAMFKHAWDQRLAHAKELAAQAKSDIKKIDTEIDELLDRIVEAGSTTLVKAYERKIAKLEQNKLFMAERSAEKGRPQRTFEEMFELALGFLSNPWKLWDSGNLELKKTALRLAFSKRISYSRESGFSNPEKSIPFKALEVISGSAKAMAHRGGFEPPTPRFVVWCSIQLSYRC